MQLKQTLHNSFLQSHEALKHVIVINFKKGAGPTCHQNKTQHNNVTKVPTVKTQQR